MILLGRPQQRSKSKILILLVGRFLIAVFETVILHNPVGNERESPLFLD
jgi:hypothetical protein